MSLPPVHKRWKYRVHQAAGYSVVAGLAAIIGYLVSTAGC